MTSGYLLDTNVVGEFGRTSAHPPVLDWVAKRSPRELNISAITMGELTRGVERLAPGRRQDELRRWLSHEVEMLFKGRILPFDDAAARRWGSIIAEAERTGRRRPLIDLQIAATALHRDLALVTRNVRDFDGFGLVLINPWPDS